MIISVARKKEIFQSVDEKITKVYNVNAKSIGFRKKQSGNRCKVMSKARRNEIKKKQETKKILLISISLVAVIVIAIAGISASFNKCDECGDTFFGKGYFKEADGEGVLGSVFGSIFGDTESVPLETVEGVILCEECVKNNVSVKAELRKAEEFKR